MNFRIPTYNYLHYILPLLYSIIIVLYPYPEQYDISWRYVNLYNDVKRNTSGFENISDFYNGSPDFIFQTFIIVFAKLKIPLQFLFFIVTWVTVFNFLWVYKFYCKEFGVSATVSGFILIFCSLSVSAVLSGIRNIHALSFIAICLILLRKKNNVLLIISFLYAVGVHFSVSLYAFFFLARKVLKSKRSVILTLTLALILLIFKYVDIKVFDFFLPDNVLHKVQFYMKNKDLWISHLEKQQWKSVAYVFCVSYSLIICFFILFHNSYKSFHSFRDELILLLLPCLFFIFYPNIYGRYYMFLVIYLAYAADIFMRKTKSYYYYYLVVLLAYGIMIYAFFKPVYYQFYEN